jgi:H+/Cl- antiporter ClcA
MAKQHDNKQQSDAPAIWSNRTGQFFERQRLRMAHIEALPQLSLVGILCGLLSGAVIIVFRILVEGAQSSFLPAGTAEAYESLSDLYRVLLAVAGGLIIGVIFQFATSSTRQVGVVHVIERLSYHQGHLPFRNAVMQFIGAALSIVSGHSVGREGPSIHLGAWAGSSLGQRLGLPNNSVRILVGCGVAAAIAAGFNTPLAGIIFAMEVVLMEYTILGFTPIILAAVSATTLTRAVFGAEPAFIVPPLEWSSIAELPYVLIMGVIIGSLGALFIQLLLWTTRVFARHPIWIRTSFAGLLIGLLAVPVPEIMGIGYDTVNEALLGEIALATLALIVGAKLVATTVGLGLGLPGGLIAPTLVIGATAGGAMGALALIWIGDVSTPGLYAMLGMGAMMGATLQAPLAALIAMLELTANPKIILPGMIAVVSAGLMAQVVFGKTSVYRMLMLARGLDYRNDPIAQALRRVGVASVMDRNIIREPRQIRRTTAETMLKKEPNWIVVSHEGEAVALLPAADLAHHLKDNDDDTIYLFGIPALRKDLSRTNVLATLQEAEDILQKTGTEALYVTGARGVSKRKIYGVLTRTEIEKAYRT